MNLDQQRWVTLEKKVSFLVDAFSKCFGIDIEDDFSNLIPELKNRSFLVNLAPLLEDIDNFDVILDTLNQAGSLRGYSFKKGTQKQKKGEPAYEKTIVCKFKDRNKDKHSYEEPLSQNALKEDEKTLIKDVDCPVKYRFQTLGGKITLISAREEHNHGPNLNLSKTLTPQMLYDLSKFKKSSNPSAIREYLENRYDVKLDYMTVYNQFRKLFPRFGVEDCSNFIQYLLKNEADYRSLPELGENDENQGDSSVETDKSLCKIVFSTKKMKENFKNFGDILIIDTTYNVNYYSTPLVVLSGVDNCYRNILFGLAFVNSEEQATYNWVLSQFDSIVQEKPQLIMSDQDKSLCAAIKNTYSGLEHRVCSWHVARNLRRKFGFLSQEYEELKKKICSLPYLYSRKQFDKDTEEILKFLKEQALDKSEKYLRDALETKSQWARSCYNRAFDANICTTSRVESWNSVIKNYLNSRSEISDIINFIENTENCYFSKKLKINKDMYQLLEYDSLLKSLKEILPAKIYDKHIVQYNLGKRDYEKRQLDPEEGKSVFEVSYVGKVDESDIFENEIDSTVPQNKYKVICGEKIACNCGFFETTGMICRHVFFISFCENIKEVKRFSVSKRWNISLEEVKKHFPVAPEPEVKLEELKKEEPLIPDQDDNEALEIVFSKENADEEKSLLKAFEEEEIEAREPKPKKVLMHNPEKVEKTKGAPKKGQTKAKKGSFIC